MGIKLRHLGHDCFEIVLPSGKVLITNPYIELNPAAPIKLEEVTGADYITVSEDDYVALADVVPLVQRFNSKVICCHEVGQILHGRPFVEGLFNLDYANVIEVRGGDTIEFDDLKVEVKKAEHISLLQSFSIRYRLEFGKEPSPGMSLAELRKVVPRRIMMTAEAEAMEEKFKAAGIVHHAEQLNFVFQTSDNLRIYYYFGGTYEFMRHDLAKGHPNILICQMYGNEAKEVAELAALSGAEVVIPLGARWPKGDDQLAQVMAKRLAELSTAHFEDLISGKWYEIGVKMSAI